MVFARLFTTRICNLYKQFKSVLRKFSIQPWLLSGFVIVSLIPMNVSSAIRCKSTFWAISMSLINPLARRTTPQICSLLRGLLHLKILICFWARQNVQKASSALYCRSSSVASLLGGALTLSLSSSSSKSIPPLQSSTPKLR